DNPAPGFQRGADRALQMVGPGGVHQQGLSARGPAVSLARDGDIADFLSPRRASRLPRLDDVQPSGAQPLDQQARLCGLAGAFAAFERDESASLHPRTMATRATDARPVSRLSTGR